MNKLPELIATLLLFSALSSCHTHRKTYTQANKIEIDSIDLRKTFSNFLQTSALAATIVLNKWTYTSTDTTEHEQILVELKKRDTTSTHFSSIGSLALQSHENDSVVQVSTKEITTQHAQNKWHWWTSLKTFALILVFALMVLCGLKAKRLLHM